MLTLKIKNKNTVEVDMVGDVTGEDYKKIRPELESLMAERGKLKFLIDLENIKSFGPSAIWEDIKFDLSNLKNVGTTAIVGTETSQQLLAKAIDVIFPEKVKFFDVSEKYQAKEWLSQY